MKIKTRFTMLVAALLTVALVTDLAGADEPKQTTKSDQDYQKKVLAWIDAYAKKQVLFCSEDLQRLRADLEQDTPEESKLWWEKSAEIRNALDSPEWEDTREWLREFLRVQAMYSDEQIAEIRESAKQAKRSGSTQEFKDILAAIENRRTRIRQGSANSRELREERLAAVNSFRRDQDAWRRAAEGNRAARSPSTPTNNSQPRRRTSRQANPPLVNSLDAARWNVMGNFWRW